MILVFGNRLVLDFNFNEYLVVIIFGFIFERGGKNEILLNGFIVMEFFLFNKEYIKILIF